MIKDPLTHLYSRETLHAQPSAIRDICALVARPEMRSLAGGWPDPAKFPIKAIRRIFDDLMAKQFSDAATNTPAQYILLEFIRLGLLDRQIQENIQFYRAKRDFMLEQMDRHFPREATWNRPQGGFFIFVKLPKNMDAADLFQRAVEKNVAFVTGQPFFVDGSGHNTFRLSYSQAGDEDMEAAIRIIGNLIKDGLAGPKPDIVV